MAVYCEVQSNAKKFFQPNCNTPGHQNWI